jgi:hypothetical protein
MFARARGPTRRFLERGGRRGAVAALAIAWALACVPLAAAGPPADDRGPDLQRAKIRDVPTWVSVPLPGEKSLVVGLPDRFWIQCPRHSSYPTSLDGDGLVLGYHNSMGGTVSLCYVGALTLPEPMAPEKIEVRAENAAKDFAADLKAKYARVEFALKDAKVNVEKATVLLGGKKAPAWRTSRHMTVPSGPFSGPDANFGGEGVLFVPPGTESLVYLFLTAKSGGTTLDRVLGDVSVKPTADVAKTPRVVQWNEISHASDGRMPVRFVSHESPPGFAPTLAVVRMTTEFAYAEDRVDEKGAVTGTLRFEQRDVPPTMSLAAVAEEERQSHAWGKPTEAVDVPLATEGARARVFGFTGSAAGRDYAARAAVFLLGDKVVRLTWTTFGDAGLAASDAYALDRLLKSMQVATRTK